MSRSIEIELKFEVLNAGGVAKFVEDQPVISKKRIVDVYLDSEAGDLFKRGIFIRVRNDEKIDIKFNKDDIGKSLSDEIEHTHCDEVSCSLPLDEASLILVNETLEFLGLVLMESNRLDTFMLRNNLIKSLVIDKRRTSYQAGEYHIDIDSVKNLGEYLEIEKMTDEHGDRTKILAGMRRWLQGLDLRHVDVGYNELYWRKYDFDLYLSGKYLLLEDREKYRPESLRS